MFVIRVSIVAAVFCATARAEPPLDAFGDPLPEGAKARVGTARLVKPVVGMWDAALLTPDGKYLISPVPGGALESVELRTGKVVGALGATGARYTGYETLALSADGARGITCAVGELTVWDARTGKVLNRVEPWCDPDRWEYWRRGPDNSVGCISADGSTFAFLTRDSDNIEQRLAVVWAVGAGKRKLDVPIEGPARLALSANGKVLAAFWEWCPVDPPGYVTTVQFWDATNGKSLGTTVLKRTSVFALTFAPDGSAVALVDGPNKLVFFDPHTGRALRKLSAHPERDSRVTFSPDGKALAYVRSDGTVVVWDVETDKPRGETRGPAYGRQVAFTDDNRLVAWGTRGARAVAWEVPSGKVLTPLGGRTGPHDSLAFSADGAELLTSGEDGSAWAVQRWDTATGKLIGTRNCELGREPHPGWRDLRLLSGTRAVGTVATNRYLFDAGTGKVLRDLGAWVERDWTARTDDGELLLVGQGARLTVKELGADVPRCEIELPGPSIESAKRTPDGKRLVTAVDLLPDAKGNRYHLILWDVATGKKLGEVSKTQTQRAFAPTDANSVVTLNTRAADHLPCLLDLTTGEVAHTFDTDKLWVRVGPVASADGKLVAFGLHGDRTDEVRVFEVSSGKLLHTFRGHTGRISALAFSPNGRLLASGAHDTTALIWELPATK